jgi:GntR family transcriptional regulator
MMTEQHPQSLEALSVALDASRPAPLYQQLSDYIRRQVLGAHWPAGSAIPSERELMRITGLSRMTVRQAIDSLTREGLLTRIHGRGTFIVPERVEQDMRGVYSFTARILAQGRTPSTHVIDAVETTADQDEAQALRIEPGTAIYRLRRLRCIDGDPAVVDIVKIPAAPCPGLLGHDLTGSLYAILTAQYNVPPLHSTDTIEAIGAPREIAKPLLVKPGTPLILMRRLATTHRDAPIELTEEFARPDRLRYRMRLYADPVVDIAADTPTEEQTR